MIDTYGWLHCQLCSTIAAAAASLVSQLKASAKFLAFPRSCFFIYRCSHCNLSIGVVGCDEREKEGEEAKKKDF